MWIWTLAVASAEPQQLDAVVRALSMRDPVSCADVEALTPTVVETLSHVVEHVAMPPWAPMKAADCLVQNHASEVAPLLETWILDPERKGLGRIVLLGLDAMPVEVAVPLATKAVTVGSEPEVARTYVARSTRPEVKAVAP